MKTKLKATPEKEDFGKKYKETNFVSRKLLDNYFKSVEILIKSIPEGEVSSAVELGCGEGYSTRLLRAMLPERVSFEASEYVAKLVPVAQANNPKVKVANEDVYSLKRKNDSVNLIFLLEVLEHLDYPEKALEEIKRVSSDYLIIGVPREPLWRILNMARGKYLKDFGNTTGHLNHWGTNAFREIVEKNFGKVLKIQTPLPWTILLAKKSKQ